MQQVDETTQQESAKEKGLVINIPISTKNAIDTHFKELKISQREKIYFLLYKIAEQGQYQLNIRNHQFMLAFSSGLLPKILKRLQNIQLIKKVKEHILNETSSVYVVLNTNKNEQQHQEFFYPSQRKLPTWVKRYIADGYTVKSDKYTHYKPDLEVSDDLATINKQQALRIQELEAEIERLRASISQPIQTLCRAQITPETEANQPEIEFRNYDIVDTSKMPENEIRDHIFNAKDGFNRIEKLGISYLKLIKDSIIIASFAA